MRSPFSRPSYFVWQGTFRELAGAARRGAVGALGAVAAVLLVPAMLLAALVATRRGRRRLERAGGVAALAAAGAWALAGALLGRAVEEIPARKAWR